MFSNEYPYLCCLDYDIYVIPFPRLLQVKMASVESSYIFKMLISSLIL